MCVAAAPPYSRKFNVIKLLIEYGGADITLKINHDSVASECLGPSEYEIKEYFDNAYAIRFNHGF